MAATKSLARKLLDKVDTEQPKGVQDAGAGAAYP